MSEVLSSIGQPDSYQKMFIKVESGIVDLVLQPQRSRKRERAIDVLVELMVSSRKNYHKIYIKCPLSNEEQTRLQGILDENSWREFLKLQKERFDIEGFISILEVYVIVTTRKKNTREGKILYLNPIDDSEFLLNIKTYIAAENHRDVKLYQFIFDEFKRFNHMSNMSSSFNIWNGGGSDFGNALMADDVLNRNFVFAIADSDKHFPLGKIGNTAKGIKFITHTRNNADFYILNDVMEAENLIPHEIVQDINPEILKLISFDLSYFDYKDGLKYIYLYDKNAREYWKSNFNGLNINWDLIENLIQGKSLNDYCEEVRNKSTLVPGFGRKLLDLVLNNEKWNSISEKDLTEAQLKEWRTLGRKLFSWTCCSKNRL